MPTIGELNYGQSSEISRPRFLAAVIFLSLLVGVVIRLPYILPADFFPVGDGGLFVTMINAIKANRYILPEFVEYNGFEIPFAYPPLGFYLVILVSRVLGLPTLIVVRYLPIVINLFTILVFVLLASELLKDRIALIVSCVLFPM